MVHPVQATAITLLQLKFASFENVDICVVLIQRFFFFCILLYKYTAIKKTVCCREFF